MNKKLKAFVLISVLLNILMGGAIAGHIYHCFAAHARITRLTENNVQQDARLKVKQALMQVNNDNKDIQEQIRKMREDTISILTADNFDEAAYDVQVGKMRDLINTRKQRMSLSIKTLAKEFSKEERILLADTLRRPPSGCKNDNEKK